jgi:hypothetical protein
MLNVGVLQIPCPIAAVLLPVLADPLLAHLVEPVPASVTSSKSAHWLRPLNPPPFGLIYEGANEQLRRHLHVEPVPASVTKSSPFLTQEEYSLVETPPPSPPRIWAQRRWRYC